MRTYYLIFTTTLSLASAGTLRGKRRTSLAQTFASETQNESTESRDFPGGNRIIGGSEARSGRYPYAVAMQDSFGQFCGGSLVAPDMILTAAHCQGGSYDVVIGRHNLNSNSGDSIAMRREIPYPQYDSRTTDGDWMLVLLDRPTSQSVPFVKLNDDGNLPSIGQEVTVMGWGDMTSDDYTQEASNVLMSVDVNAMSNAECDASEGEINGWTDSYNGQITDNMLCAADNGQDSCQGDSGGPLVIQGRNGDGSDDIQIGVVSWGVGCASAHFPGVYARVSQVYDWIASEVCANSSDPPAELCNGGAAAAPSVDYSIDNDDDDDYTPQQDDGLDDDFYYDDTFSSNDNSLQEDDDIWGDDDDFSYNDDGPTSADNQPTYAPVTTNDNYGSFGSYGNFNNNDDDGTSWPTYASTAPSDNDDGVTTNTPWPTWAPTTGGATYIENQPTAATFTLLEPSAPVVPQQFNINDSVGIFSDGSWITIIEDDFNSDFGFFNSGGNHAKWLNEKKGRNGVLNIRNGQGDMSSVYSNAITDTSYSIYRVVFSAYLLSMEIDDEFCLDISVDEGASWVVEKCWGDIDLKSKLWHDDVTAEFEADNASELMVRFRCQANDNQDDVYIDKVVIQGLQ